MICSKCRRQIPRDSVFCPYCGEKQQTPKNTLEATELQRTIDSWLAADNTEAQSKQSTQDRNPSYPNVIVNSPKQVVASHAEAMPRQESESTGKTKRRFWGIAIAAIAVAVIASVIGFIDYSAARQKAPPKSTVQTALPLPVSGTVYTNRSPLSRTGKLTIKCSSGSSCFIKLKTASGSDDFSFFVRSGDTVTMDVPAGKFYVYFAHGNNWYGPSDLFGEDTYYAMDSQLQDFSVYELTYTLYPVQNGNFSETKIDKDQF